MSYRFLLGICCLLTTASWGKCQIKVWSDEEETTEYWNAKGQEELRNALEKEVQNTLSAKNIILFLGDGMGIPTVTAGRILKGQLHNATGEEYQLSMEKFPHVGLSRTYSVDRQTTDSAATATAYLCGVKTKYGTLGLSGDVERTNCASSKDKNVESILVDAYNAGKSTGVISTVHLTHASPAATYAHIPERNWYSDARLTQEAKDNGCDDIAKQFYDSSNMITVAMSGGRSFFRPNDVADEEYPTEFGEREDGQDYIQKWIDDASGEESRKYVWNKSGLDGVDPITTDKLLGLFEREDMAYDIDRDQDKEPSLAEMVEKSIQILRKNENGYFLFVEGGKIDLGHHVNDAVRALYDTVAFDDAIEKAAWMTSESDTLIVVTADHSHTMSFGGYTWRGNPILAKTPYEKGDTTVYYIADDGKPYTSILYNNGPAYQGKQTDSEKLVREDLLAINTGAKDYLHQSAVPHEFESHGGEDVAIYARGPMSHLFHGVHEQSYIPYVMRYASCIGENTEHCSKPEVQDSTTETSETNIQYFITFINLNLTLTDTLAALYVQFVLVLSLSLFAIFLVFLIFRDPPKRWREELSKQSFKYAFTNDISEL